MKKSVRALVIIGSSLACFTRQVLSKVCCLVLAVLYMQHTFNLLNHVILFRLSFLNEKNASLSNKLKLVTEETLSSEDKALRMEEILKDEEKIVKVKCFSWFLQMRIHLNLQFLSRTNIYGLKWNVSANMICSYFIK